MKPTRFSFTAITLLILLPVAAGAQGTRADYQRATGLRERYESLAINVPGPATWIDKTSRFWYRKSV